VIFVKGGCVTVADASLLMPARARSLMVRVWNVNEECGSMVDASSNVPFVTVFCARMISLSIKPAVRNWREKASNVSVAWVLLLTYSSTLQV